MHRPALFFIFLGGEEGGAGYEVFVAAADEGDALAGATDFADNLVDAEAEELGLSLP